jgi:type I restriction enzyme S subunit
MKHKWPMVKLGEVLRRSEETVAPVPDAEYREITVRLWGNGVVERRRALGASLSGRRFVARAGQFIASRIDARNGAMGLVPEELDGAVVSNDFPLFNLNHERIEPAFLGWLCRTAGFVELCQRASEGTTNRVRLKEDRFLALQIPLPPLSEQRRIVARIEELAAQINEARTLRQQAAEEAEALIHASISKLGYQSGWEMKPLGAVAEINPSHGRNVKLQPSDKVTFVPMKAVDDSTGKIRWPETKEFHELSKGYTWFENGDVIFARITPCMQNGKVALAQNLVNGVGFGSTEFHIIRAQGKVHAEWIYYLVRHQAFRDSAAEHFKGTAGQQRVPQSFLEKSLIPVPPLDDQRRIVAELDALQAEVDRLKTLQAQTAAELDALLPAILDRAFKGEL